MGEGNIRIHIILSSKCHCSVPIFPRNISIAICQLISISKSIQVLAGISVRPTFLLVHRGVRKHPG